MAETFGAMLKTWRDQRRMSQLDLGLAANVSARHISFLETGRAKPSQSMVLQLSETLEIPRTVRNQLLNAAGFSGAYQARDLADQELEFVRGAMDWTLERHDPFPAIALDKYWKLLRANACATLLLSSMGIREGDSLLDKFTRPGPTRDAIENWTEVARHVMTRLRTESAHLGGDAILDEGVDRLRQALRQDKVDDTAALPAITTTRYNANGLNLSFFSTIAQFGSAEDIALADIKIELMFPADRSTKETLISMFTED